MRLRPDGDAGDCRNTGISLARFGSGRLVSPKIGIDGGPERPHRRPCRALWPGRALEPSVSTGSAPSISSRSSPVTTRRSCHPPNLFVAEPPVQRVGPGAFPDPLDERFQMKVVPCEPACLNHDCPVGSSPLVVRVHLKPLDRSPMGSKCPRVAVEVSQTAGEERLSLLRRGTQR